MARRYDSKEAKRRILTACVRLFLEKGYTNTKVAEILKEADVSAGSFQNIFRTKDGVLTELIGMMFSRQFGAVRPLAANAPSPVYLYAVETALQLAVTELSENLRDIYVEAYTFSAVAGKGDVTPDMPAELDRVFKITDGILRSIIVAVEE